MEHEAGVCVMLHRHFGIRKAKGLPVRSLCLSLALLCCSAPVFAQHLPNGTKLVVCLDATISSRGLVSFFCCTYISFLCCTPTSLLCRDAVRANLKLSGHNGESFRARNLCFSAEEASRSTSSKTHPKPLPFSGRGAKTSPTSAACGQRSPPEMS